MLSSRRDKEGNLVIKKFRNAFTGIPDTPVTRTVLDKMSISYVVSKQTKELHIIGDEAFTIANRFHKEVRRPMRKGVLSDRDKLARDMMSALIQSLLGKPSYSGELCVYTVPAFPIEIEDEDDFNLSYHHEFIKSIVSSLGYTPMSINEGLCLIYEGLGEKENYSGIGISFGGGMVNVCYAQYGLADDSTHGASFSTLKAGDRISSMAAQLEFNRTVSSVNAAKESSKNPIDITQDYSNSLVVRHAITIHYHKAIEYLAKNLVVQLADRIDDSSPKVVVGGGTSLIKGFMPVFKSYLEKEAKGIIKLGEIIHLNDPITAITRGALKFAELQEKEG